MILIQSIPYEDSIALSTIPLVNGDSFEYDIELLNRHFTFEYKRRKVRINLNVDLPFQKIQDLLAMVFVI